MDAWVWFKRKRLTYLRKRRCLGQLGFASSLWHFQYPEKRENVSKFIPCHTVEMKLRRVRKDGKDTYPVLWIVSDSIAHLSHVGLKLFPGLSSISWSVNGALPRFNQDDVLGVTAPHDVVQLWIELKNLKVHPVSVGSQHTAEHGQKGDGEKACTFAKKSFVLMIVSLIFALRWVKPTPYRTYIHIPFILVYARNNKN